MTYNCLLIKELPISPSTAHGPADARLTGPRAGQGSQSTPSNRHPGGNMSNSVDNPVSHYTPSGITTSIAAINAVKPGETREVPIR